MKKLLLFAMLAMGLLVGAAHGEYRRVDTYVLATGAPADSLASNTFFTSAIVPIAGASEVVFMIRDTVFAAVPSDGSTCCSPYADSLGAALLGVSVDGVHFHEVNFGSALRAVNDTLQIAFTGKLIGHALSYSVLIGGNRSGYLVASLSPHQNSATAAANFSHIPYNYARLRLAPTGRPRCPTCTGAFTAPILGLRVVAYVYYSTSTDPYVPPGARY